MDDYMSLIKNPKARSPRVPTSPLAANQRQSPSSPNMGSTSSLNLSTLNRPIAQNPYAQPTNIFNPQPLSRRSSQIASPLDQSNDSILRRSTPSFIMNTTSQIIPRPQGMDQSLSGSAARTRDQDYDGLNRASQISRRSQVGSIERSPSFGVHNDSLRDSIVKISKKLDKKRKKIDWALVLLGFVVLAIAFLLLRVIFPSKVVYCDTGVFDMDSCTPCPPQGKCAGGELIECVGTFTKHKNQCVESYEAKARFAKYRKYISDKLAVKKGEKLCNEKARDDYDLSEVLEVLKKHFHHDTYLQNLDVNNPVDLIQFEADWDGLIERGSDAIIYEVTPGIYKTKAVADPPFSCKMSLLWTEGKLFGIWIALFIATVIVLFKFAVTRVVYTNLAKELYNEVLDHLSYWQKATVKTLKREFEPRYPDKDFEKLWHYMEELVIRGGRINRYFDYYRDEKQVQEFWALLY